MILVSSLTAPPDPMKAGVLWSQLEAVGSAGCGPQGCVAVQPQARMSCLGLSCQCQLAAMHFKLIPSQKTRKNYGSISLSVRQGCGQCNAFFFNVSQESPLGNQKEKCPCWLCCQSFTVKTGTVQSNSWTFESCKTLICIPIFLFIKNYNYLLYIQVAGSPACLFSQSFLLVPLHSHPSPQSTPHSFLFRQGQVSHE